MACADKEKKKNQYLRPLNRIAKKFDKNLSVDVDFEGGSSVSLILEYFWWLDNEKGNMKKAVLPKLEKALFDIKQDKYSINASKTLKIEGTATIKELEDILGKALEQT